ncbi:MAG: hypothetical protein AMXMBFR84_37730 [Candidatus Hydrogenedentota bacterium]
MAKAAENSDIFVLNQDRLSALFGVTSPAVKKWRDQYGCPVRADGLFDLRVVLPWYAAWRDMREKEMADDTDPELRRKRAAEADIAEWRRDKLRLELMDKHRTMEVFTAVAARIRQAGEILLRDYGDRAALVVDEAIDDAVQIARRMFSVEALAEAEAKAEAESATDESEPTPDRPKRKSKAKSAAKKPKAKKQSPAPAGTRTTIAGAHP